MSEFEDKLNSLLNDPAQMEKITEMAQSLMGGGSSSGSVSPQPAASMFEGLDPGMLQSMGKLIAEMNQGPDDKQVLLEAMKPYLGEKRRAKMDRALKLAKMARLAGLAFGQFGGKFHV